MREHLPIGWIEERLADVIEPRGEKVSPSDFPEYKFIGMDHVESQTTKIIGFVPASEMKSNALGSMLEMCCTEGLGPI